MEQMMTLNARLDAKVQTPNGSAREETKPLLQLALQNVGMESRSTLKLATTGTKQIISVVTALARESLRDILAKTIVSYLYAIQFVETNSSYGKKTVMMEQTMMEKDAKMDANQTQIHYGHVQKQELLVLVSQNAAMDFKLKTKSVTLEKTMDVKIAKR